MCYSESEQPRQSLRPKGLGGSRIVSSCGVLREPDVAKAIATTLEYFEAQIPLHASLQNQVAQSPSYLEH